ncbi:hypothetical protein Thi970DRAFT_00355 [Thiorhodovibrio frisius]|uniref:Uncharacterized protein n=1 Tax=Thiorhodovibrio frisius TaxID=631362 RepID=H8YW52_9GAMM|nr:hypothetical protein Thi970DRAFT_00355 [Thiorhodovibrio frisius]WPL22973.1 hypothetical protein Thiofri_03153 [Thiorhodovibrio frisius]WPL23245.1 hypothetical protein Thiofri_03430 [Thiorhodovibrio frisius]
MFIVINRVAVLEDFAEMFGVMIDSEVTDPR